jgi:hypothetical protein
MENNDIYNQVIITSGGKIKRKESVYETIGIAIINPRGIAAAKKSIIIGDNWR